MRAASSNITFLKTQLKRNSVWRPRQKFYFFQTANQAENRCGDGEKLLLFFQTSKASTRLSLSSFLLFFKDEKRLKTDFSKAKNRKFSDPKKVRKKDHFGQKPVFRGSHETPKSGFRARLGLKIFPANPIRSVESRRNFFKK